MSTPNRYILLVDSVMQDEDVSFYVLRAKFLRLRHDTSITTLSLIHDADGTLTGMMTFTRNPDGTILQSETPKRSATP